MLCKPAVVRVSLASHWPVKQNVPPPHMQRSVFAFSSQSVSAFSSRSGVPGAQVRNVQNPAALAGVSLLTVLLATAGNALMVPRALWTRDTVWLSGSGWGAAMGWAQIASLHCARTPAGWARTPPALSLPKAVLRTEVPTGPSVPGPTLAAARAQASALCMLSLKPDGLIHLPRR